MTTENLGELFAALAAARLEFSAFAKSKTATIRSQGGASYQYSYADLSDIIDATANALAKHGLVIIQEPEVVNENGKMMVVINGCIAHKSGGVYVLRPLALPVVGGTAQAVGSAISYARRYQLGSVLNLAASDDDDGQAAQGGESHAPQQSAPPQQRKQPPPQQPAQKKMDPDLLKRLDHFNTLGEELYGDKWPDARARNTYRVSEGRTQYSNELTIAEVETLINGMLKLKEKQPQPEAA